MSSLESKSKSAAQARAQLQQKLIQCAAALQQAANVLTACGTELAESATLEATATGEYIAALEAALTRQKVLS